MSNIGIFYGSDTGSTQKLARLIQQDLAGHTSQVFDIAASRTKDFAGFSVLLLGIPTLTDGAAQGDWQDFLPTLGELDLTGKYVALFGCADQYYTRHFADAIGTLREAVAPLGATMVGQWPAEGYTFEASRGLVDKDTFAGLVIDADGQPEYTRDRVRDWTRNVLAEVTPATGHMPNK